MMLTEVLWTLSPACMHGVKQQGQAQLCGSPGKSWLMAFTNGKLASCLSQMLMRLSKSIKKPTFSSGHLRKFALMHMLMCMVWACTSNSHLSVP